MTDTLLQAKIRPEICKAQGSLCDCDMRTLGADTHTFQAVYSKSLEVLYADFFVRRVTVHGHTTACHRLGRAHGLDFRCLLFLHPHLDIWSKKARLRKPVYGPLAPKLCPVTVRNCKNPRSRCFADHGIGSIPKHVTNEQNKQSGGQLDNRLALVPSERPVSHACNLLKRDSRLDVTKLYY